MGANKSNKETLRELFEAKQDFYIESPNGTGKTCVATEVAQEYGYEVVTAMLPGAPLGDVTWLINQAFQDKDPAAKYFLLVEYVNYGDEDMQNVLLPIIDTREINGQKFPHLLIGAEGNPPNGKCCFPISPLLKNRLKSVE